MASVDDDEIRDGIRLLARTTGVFAETAGGVTVAVLHKLVESGAIDTSRGDRRLQHRRRAEDDRRGEPRRAPTAIIPPTMKGMREAGLLVVDRAPGWPRRVPRCNEGSGESARAANSGRSGRVGRCSDVAVSVRPLGPY